MHRALVRAGLVRVELATPDSIADPAARAACEALLSSDERARAGRIRVGSARERYVLAHGLARRALADALALAPARLAFRSGTRGKPEVAEPPEALALRFNLSHGDGLAACAITRGVEVGVDVEALDRALDPLTLAERFFAPSETNALRALDPAARGARFLTLWTLKEAVSKALGSGIGSGLRGVVLSLTGAEPALLPGGAAGDPRDWQLALLAPTPRHLLALALQRGAGPDLRVEVAHRGGAFFSAR